MKEDPAMTRARLVHPIHTYLFTLGKGYFQTGRESDKMDGGLEKTYTRLDHQPLFGKRTRGPYKRERRKSSLDLHTPSSKRFKQSNDKA